MFKDEEGDLYNLVKKCTGENDPTVRKFVSEIEDEASKVSDKEFIGKICTQEIFKEFFKRYKEWRTHVVPARLVQIVCEYIEELHPAGRLLHIVDIVEGRHYAYLKIIHFS